MLIRSNFGSWACALAVCLWSIALTNSKLHACPQVEPPDGSNANQQQQDAQTEFDAALDAMEQYIQETQVRNETASQDDRVRFSFANWEWKRVIEWFAEQTNMNLQPIADPPQGTFTYISDEDYSLTEAMDILNDHLFRKGYTLVRNRRTLKLAQLNRDFPSELVEEITPEKLDERGRFEILRCRFDLSGLDMNEMERQIRNLTDRNVGESVPYYAANFIVVRDTGEKLRMIRELINMARELKTQKFSTYTLKNVGFEEAMTIIRPLLGMNGNSMPDGSLTVVSQPLSNDIFVRGTERRIQEFLDAVRIVDVPAERMTVGSEAPVLRQYTVRSDPELAFKVVQTMLVGRDVKADLDTRLSAIFIYGREADHEIVAEVIRTIESGDGSLKEFELRNLTTSVAIEALQNLFGIDPADTTATRKSPIFYADKSSSRIIIRGTPTDLMLAQSMIEMLDRDTGLAGNGIRPNTVRIDANDRQMDRVQAILEDLWPSTNRQNRLQIIMPEERRSRTRRSLLPPVPSHETLPGEHETTEDNDQSINTSSRLGPSPRRPTIPTRFVSTSWTSTASEPTQLDEPIPAAAKPADQPQDEVGRTSAEQLDDSYKPAPQRPSVPGAPVTVRFTDAGIIITSDDLDAVEDMRLLIQEVISGSSVSALPQVYYLQFRGANETKGMLDSILGIGGSGGGGNMFGNLIGGAMGNMFGGGMGDMMSGLLGGGGGGETAGIELEGTVTTVADVRNNALVIWGATENDLELLDVLIEFLDTEEAPHAPSLLGQTYYIPIMYREPEEVEQIVRAQMGPSIRSSGGGDGQADALRAQMQMMQQLQQMLGRGGRGGGGGQSNDEEKPKAALGIDRTNRALLVTGPRYIYEEVSRIVRLCDQPPYNPNHKAEYYKSEYNVPIQDIVTILQQLDPSIRVVLGNADLQQQSNQQQQQRPQTGQQNQPQMGQPTQMQFNPQQMMEMFRNAAGQRGGQQGGGRGGRGGQQGGGFNQGGGRGGRGG